MSEGETLKAWIGRANEDRYQLLQDGENVAEDAVSRVVLRLNKGATEICVDSDEDHPIDVSSTGIVTMQLGLVADITPGLWRGQLRVYDADAPEGIMWQRFIIEAFASPDCEPETT